MDIYENITSYTDTDGLRTDKAEEGQSQYDFSQSTASEATSEHKSRRIGNNARKDLPFGGRSLEVSNAKKDF